MARPEETAALLEWHVDRCARETDLRAKLAARVDPSLLATDLPEDTSLADLVPRVLMVAAIDRVTRERDLARVVAEGAAWDGAVLSTGVRFYWQAYAAQAAEIGRLR